MAMLHKDITLYKTYLIIDNDISTGYSGIAGCYALALFP